jgi:acetyl esterase/lipase
LPIQDWKISPILATNFSNLAPALVFTAELDPLRDEGEAYAAKMDAAGSRARLIRVPGVPHPFAAMDAILDGAKQYNETVIEELKIYLRG